MKTTMRVRRKRRKRSQIPKRIWNRYLKVQETLKWMRRKKRKEKQVCQRISTTCQFSLLCWQNHLSVFISSFCSSFP